MVAGNVKRGQASPVSVAILTAAVLTMGLLLYSFFTSHYSDLNRRQGILSLAGSVSSYVDGGVVSEFTGSSGVYQLYCYIVTIRNSNPAESLTVYLSLLPVSRAQTGGVTVSQLISQVPVDAGTGTVTVYAYNLTDANNDGYVDIVGGIPLITLSLPGVTCAGLYSNVTVRDNTLPYERASPASVYLDVDYNVLSYVGSKSYGTPPYIPLWRVTLPPLGKADMLFIVASPASLDQASLAVFVRVGNDYYLAHLMPLAR